MVKDHFDQRHEEAYVWIWLPHKTQPVVAGRIVRQGDGRLLLNYGQSYLARENAIAIDDPELPLRAGEIPLHDKLQLPNCIRYVLLMLGAGVSLLTAH